MIFGRVPGDKPPVYVDIINPYKEWKIEIDAILKKDQLSNEQLSLQIKPTLLVDAGCDDNVYGPITLIDSLHHGMNCQFSFDEETRKIYKCNCEERRILSVDIIFKINMSPPDTVATQLFPAAAQPVTKNRQIIDYLGDMDLQCIVNDVEL